MKYIAPYKPKRVRKSKKAYFRGELKQLPAKQIYHESTINFRNMVFFFVVIAALISYLPITFLLEKMYTPLSLEPLGKSLAETMSALPLPHIALSLPALPGITLPAITLPTVDTHAIERTILNFFAAINPLPFVTDFLGTIGNVITHSIQILTQAVVAGATRTATVVQTYSIMFADSLVNIFVIAGKLLTTSIVRILTGIITASLWIAEAAKEYLQLLRTIIAGSGILIFHAANIVGVLLEQILLFVIEALINAVILSAKLLLTTIETTALFINNMLAGIQVFFLRILLACLVWIETLVIAVKRNLDMLFTVIGAFIHQFDPEAQFISSSFAESTTTLFSGMAKILTAMPLVFRSASL